MKIVSWNINGLRAVYRKGFLKSLAKINPDIIGLQEIKAQENQLPQKLINLPGYQLVLNNGLRPGYSGTAVYCKSKPLSVKKTLGLKRFDNEGRLIEVTFPEFSLINLYLPHGGRRKENMTYKMLVYEQLFNYIKGRKKLILIGDFNVAHEEIDLARPKDNQDNTGFTPEERAKIDQLLSLGFIDSFRLFNSGANYYSFWVYYARARERNIGWRIDYCFVSRDLKKSLKEAFILNQFTGSDHCPVGIEMRD